MPPFSLRCRTNAAVNPMSPCCWMRSLRVEIGGISQSKRERSAPAHIWRAPDHKHDNKDGARDGWRAATSRASMGAAAGSSSWEQQPRAASSGGAPSYSWPSSTQQKNLVLYSVRGTGGAEGKAPERRPSQSLRSLSAGGLYARGGRHCSCMTEARATKKQGKRKDVDAAAEVGVHSSRRRSAGWI